ncbi:hypothetical protein CYLTODRAFT_486190 [Cylindrobasidium torrendii FP15055 ss-10]|uniref:Uncharacterized protein n=1 Tax=Cylindrobasidium torrendii FP15055 ss-10 TaxID=1314674 RepID=A0A0D7BPP7_9AGAR|nr:hypothetical protein CYLTODRAFT_486190 [Cylindrobasidium torrendii FP15055 ss-10]
MLSFFSSLISSRMPEPEVALHPDASEPPRMFAMIPHTGARIVRDEDLAHFAYRWSQPCLHVQSVALQSMLRESDWPQLPTLERDRGSRKLVKVYSFDVQYGVIQWTNELFRRRSASVQIHVSENTGESPHLCVEVPQREAALQKWQSDPSYLIRNLLSVSDILEILETYVLPGVCTVVHELTRLDDREPIPKFYPEFPKMHTPNAPWTILNLKNCMHILYVDPSQFSKEDMARLTCQARANENTTFRNGELDRFYPDAQPDPHNKGKGRAGRADITRELWAVLYDACLPPTGGAFAVTNYTYWQFGYFEEDRSCAHITLPVKATIDCCLDMDGTPDYQHLDGPNALQILSFWVASALGRTAFDFT